MKKDRYFDELRKEIDKIYKIANLVRKKGFDPDVKVAVSYTHLTLPTTERV